jgi:nucleosome binding factor SPN SPT16 subunit
MVQTADARRSAYDPDELEEEQRDRERQKKLNSEFKRFTQRVQDAWDNEHPRLKLEWDKPVRCAPPCLRLISVT